MIIHAGLDCHAQEAVVGSHRNNARLQKLNGIVR